jgi:hypothetical protein
MDELHQNWLFGTQEKGRELDKREEFGHIYRREKP